MSREIIGGVFSLGLPKPNLNQTDPSKGDYVKGKDAIPTKVSQLENDSGFLTQHQDISGKLDADKLPEAVEDALAQAKASGEFDGKNGDPGVSPTVAVSTITGGHRITITDKNGTKTVDVMDGEDGEPGRGIKSIARTSGNGAAGTVDTYTITYTDNTTGTFQVRNGSNGAPGQAATLEITGATALAYGAAPTVTEQSDSTDQARKYKLGIPAGKPGEPGDPGKTPVRGEDYWTDADKAEIEAFIASELAKRGQIKPEFAQSMEWLEANGDTSKLYVLPDDMIYAYMLAEKEAEVGGYTNRLPMATADDRTTIYGEDYNGDGVNDGYKKGTRLSGSSGLESTNDISCASGFIPATVGDIVRIKGFYGPSGVGTYMIAYSSANASTGKQEWPSQDDYDYWWGNKVGSSVAADKLTWGTADKNTEIITVTLTEALFGSGFNAIRFSGIIDENTIVTINEEIKEGSAGIVTEETWVSTGHAFVPADYEDRIVAVEDRTLRHTAEIAELKKAADIGGVGDATEAAALKRIKEWDKPVYDAAPVTLLPDERTKPALTTSDRTVSAVYAKYRALMAKHPKYIAETNLGKSASSDAFAAVDVLRFDFREPDGLVESSRYTVNETKPKIILMSGVHNEYAGIYGLYYALEEIAENPEFDDIRRNAHIIVVPCSNPFGLTSQAAIDGWQMSHVNANGVAIHNNFGVEHNTYNADANVGEFNYGGTAPYSEPETQYIDRLMAENTDAIAFVTCHNYNKDTVFGSLVIWASSATAYMCNLAYRLIDKLSKAWHGKYGPVLQEAIDNYRTDALPEGETRLGWAQYSTSAGTEQLNATKYGILATNLEISDNMRVFSDAQFSSDVMTRGAEVYANFFRTILRACDHKDKKEYAPNLPWEG